jgi:putative membrane protein
VLVGIWAVALAISSLSARRNQLWNLTRLLPAIKI